ncbi:hypothetical protein ACIBG8_33465 [Nonomuraea sp. NPDC050556]|uniref:hypothetical protein n=1 Tax=Nonomuraea sp. NPDC050556 TaxID=3364369 RepID=UPI0037B16A0F
MTEAQLPSDVDPALWFESAPCGRHYLVEGNPHTFPGRMYAYCVLEGIYTRVSKQDIEVCSRETEYFVRGYLSGDEPDPRDPPTARWQRSIELFRQTGFWRDDPGPCELCGATLLHSEAPAEGQPCTQCPPA